ncbi:hypothetical protein BCR35DRAFT_310873 [Leucosporidium creatinivorum]|uniref:RING-type domain-containing protein n=1 Tax=Leucosporidium creatinivorum TaxID=106004 RepID=A0A1Y2CM55_9BASI|nr:hypothetical protein BCR35DRAFT_310873 [Leucosporidium creatinivorum]
MGIPVELFLDTVPEHLICTICQDVLERGTMSGCTEDHPYCLKCVRTWVRQRETCPTCRQPTSRSRLRETQLLRREVGCLRSRCSDNECNWQGEYSDLQAHLDSTCNFHPRPCSNRGCTVLVSALQLPQHLDVACALTLFSCARGGKHCGGPNRGCFTRGAGRAGHDAVCGAYRCPNFNCTTVGTLNVMQAHAPGCAWHLQHAVDLHHSVQALTNELAQARQHILTLEALQHQDAYPHPTIGMEMDAWANKRARNQLPPGGSAARLPMGEVSNGVAVPAAATSTLPAPLP